jgi:hypothetical protein
MAFYRLKRGAEIAGHRLREMLGPAGKERYGIKAEYRHRSGVTYFYDTDASIVYQPDVYRLAATLARQMSARYLVDIGCGHARKLLEAAALTSMAPVGIDFGANLEHCRRNHPEKLWVAADLEQPAASLVSGEILRDSVLICADVIEHLRDPDRIVEFLRQWLSVSRLCVLTTPERDLEHGRSHRGPPPNPHHVREWNAAELKSYLLAGGLNVLFVGLTRSSDRSAEMKTSLVLLGPTSSTA